MKYRGLWLQIGLLLVLGDLSTSARAETDGDVAALTRAGIKPDAAGLRKYLEPFLPGADYERKAAALIRQFGSDKWQQREAATKALAQLPVLPREALEQAARSPDAEVRSRARGLLAEGDANGRAVLNAALAVTAKRGIKGLAAHVIAAGAFCRGPYQRRVLDRALVATATPADAPTLRRALGSKAPLVRSAAAAALDHLLGDKAGPDLRKLLKDPDDLVRLAASRLLGSRGERASLTALAGLLLSEDLLVRTRSVQILRALSGQKLGYAAHDPADKRNKAAAKWRAWAGGAGQTAKLRFPIPDDGVVDLLGGTDLTGWQAVDNGQKVDAKRFWQVKDGVLVFQGDRRGYLYHERPLTDYVLTLEWRWPGKEGDSGVWFLMAKPGAARPACLEVQLLSGKAGDFWLIGGFRMTVAGRPAAGHVVKSAASSERPIGQWNRMTITVLGGAVTVKVNGVVQNKAADCPRGPSHVALQAEGDAIHFRNIRVQPL